MGGILVLIWRTLRERTKYAGSGEGQKCVVFGTSVRAGGGLGKNGQGKKWTVLQPITQFMVTLGYEKDVGQLHRVKSSSGV